MRIPKGFRLKAQGCEARATLGWRCVVAPTPTGLWPARTEHRRNPVGVEANSLVFSQGSSCLATLGWRTQSPWDWAGASPAIASSRRRVRASVLFSLTFLFLAAFVSSLSAHEVRPAYLELRQTGLETYDAFWKLPGQGENLRLGLYVELPAGSTNVTPPRATMANNAFTERWTLKRAGGLSGGTIHIAGLSATMTDVLVRLERLDGTTQVTRLTPSAPSFVVEAAPSRLEVGRTFTVLGIEHILTGIDHLLFVLALIIICLGTGATRHSPLATRHFRLSLDSRHWTLLKTVTAFTFSHSLTLTAATLGLVHVPPPPVEAVIALSIVFVAAEIVRQGRGVPGLTARAPWIVAFAFGLIHGLGFAGGLSDAGLPAGHIPTALLFFSLGVEAGHFLFIGVVLSLIAFGRQAISSSALGSRITHHASRISLIPPYAIGATAMFWLLQRLAAF